MKGSDYFLTTRTLLCPDSRYSFLPIIPQFVSKSNFVIGREYGSSESPSSAGGTINAPAATTMVPKTTAALVLTTLPSCERDTGRCVMFTVSKKRPVNGRRLRLKALSFFSFFCFCSKLI